MAFTLGELLDKNFPPEEYHIGQGMLSKGSLMIIGGDPKTYKSFLLNTIVQHLALGTPLFEAYRRPHGREEACWPCRPSRVLLIEQEVGYPDLKERMAGLTYALTPDQLAAFRKNVVLESQNYDIKLDTIKGNSIIHKLMNAHRPDVVCFDPLAELHNSDENDSASMSKVFEPINSIRSHYGCSVILTHHTRKPNADVSSNGTPHLLRGSGIIYAKGDSYLMLSVKNRNARIIRIRSVFRRAAPIGDYFLQMEKESTRFRFHRWGDSLDNTEDDSRSN